MKTLTVKLPEELAAQLARGAQSRGKSKSEFIREAIAYYVYNGAEKAEVSCFELASDLAGSFAGPADLSTNPKHLDGFGQ